MKDYIFQKHVYRISLSLIIDLGLVNFAMKADTKILITLEREMNKFFETNKKLAAIPTQPDTLINIYDRLYISYQELKLTETSEILRSERALRQGVLPSPYQQLFEINTGTPSFTCTFKGAQRQFDWLEISIVFDKSYQ